MCKYVLILVETGINTIGWKNQLKDIITGVNAGIPLPLASTG